MLMVRLRIVENPIVSTVPPFLVARFSRAYFMYGVSCWYDLADFFETVFSQLFWRKQTSSRRLAATAWLIMCI